MRRFGAYLWDVCLGEKFPVWATLIGVVAGVLLTALGTYLIVPGINQSLEKQKIRTEFVIRNLDDLNSRTRTLVSEISDLHAKVLRTNEIDAASIQKTTSRIAEMQWKAIELAVIFEGNKKSAPVIVRYQSALEDVRTALINLKSKDDLALSQKNVEEFSRRTLDVIRELAALGGLSIGSVVPPKS